MTPTLSVDAVQERLIWDEETADAERFVGVEGGMVSGGGGGGGGGGGEPLHFTRYKLTDHPVMPLL